MNGQLEQAVGFSKLRVSYKVKLFKTPTQNGSALKSFFICGLPPFFSAHFFPLAINIHKFP